MVTWGGMHGAAQGHIGVHKILTKTNTFSKQVMAIGGVKGQKKTFVDVVALYSPLLMALVPTKNIEYFVHSRADVCEKRPFSDPKIG